MSSRKVGVGGWVCVGVGWWVCVCGCGVGVGVGVGGCVILFVLVSAKVGGSVEA